MDKITDKDIEDLKNVVEHGFDSFDEDIDTLNKLLAYYEQGQWVSVEDELPKNAMPVIISGGCGHYSHKEKNWFTNMEVDCYGAYRPIQWKVTHWQPLPEPPKENTNG